MTPRAVAVALVSVAVLCGITPYNDFKLGSTYIAGNFFPIGALSVVLLLVLGVNSMLWKRRPGSMLSPGELLTVWAMITVASGIPSSGLMRYLIPHLVAPAYYAKPENRWQDVILDNAPARLMVTDPQAAKWFFDGLPRYLPIPWRAWLEPLALWGILVLLLFFAFFCVTAILRKQWVEHEKFSFPLIRLPVMVAQPPTEGHRLNSLLRSPLFWMAAASVTFIHTMKGLHLYFPEVPDLTLFFNLDPVLEPMPWRFARPLHLRVYPLVIGFAYFLSSEVCFSLWFFYLFYKLQVVIGAYCNWQMPGMQAGYGNHAFHSFEAAGGCLALFAWMLWVARPHLLQVWRRARYRDPSVDDSREPLSYRMAVFGLIGACAGIFAWQTAAGIHPLMAAAQIAIGGIIFVVVSWLVCQAGLLFVQPTFSAAEVMSNAFGAGAFNTATQFMTSQVDHVLLLDLRESMLPSLLNAHRAADEGRVDRRRLTQALAAAVVVSLVVSAVAAIVLPYRNGGGLALSNTWTYIHSPQISLRWAANMANAPIERSSANLGHFAGGGMGVWMLLWLRSRCPTLGLHPAGFLIASGYPMYMLWFSFFLGWLLKGPIVRYGGLRGYVRFQPIFLGLVLGDCLNAALWILIGFRTGVGYSVLPG